MLLNHQEMPQPLWISGSQWVVVVQSLSHVWLFMTPWTVAHQASLSFTISQSFSNSCPLNLWCHPIISFSFAPFSSFQSFPASESFPMSLFFASGGQSIGAPASISVLPMNTQSWFSLGWSGLISLLSSGLCRVFSSTTVQKHQFFSAQLSLWSNSHIHTWVVGKAIALTKQTFVGKVLSLLFNTLGVCIGSRFVHNRHWAQKVFPPWLSKVIVMTGMLSAGGCDRPAKRGREEPPHVRGQGQKLGGPHSRRAASRRSYPTSEVRGRGREYQTATAQEQPRGDTPRPRSGGQLRGDTQRPRSGAAAGRRYSMLLSPRPRAAGGSSYPTPLSQRPGAAGGRSRVHHEKRWTGRNTSWNQDCREKYQ